jgi:hypothetical protein
MNEIMPSQDFKKLIIQFKVCQICKISEHNWKDEFFLKFGDQKNTLIFAILEKNCPKNKIKIMMLL